MHHVRGDRCAVLTPPRRDLRSVINLGTAKGRPSPCACALWLPAKPSEQLAIVTAFHDPRSLRACNLGELRDHPPCLQKVED